MKARLTRLMSEGKVYNDVPVAEGKLVLVEIKYNGKANPNVISLNKGYYQPIIISETEKIEKGDWVYATVSKSIHQVTRTRQSRNDATLTILIEGDFCWECSINLCRKVLVLPEHFSTKHLQAIVDGKMKDGDKVLIECERVGIHHMSADFIKFNTFGYIILHKIEEKTYTEKDMYDIASIAWATGSVYGPKGGQKEFEDWYKRYKT